MPASSFLTHCFNSLRLGPCTDGEIRLENGKVDNEGRVQICYNNEWGTVCNTGWGQEEAMVVCRQLGFLTESEPQVTYYNHLNNHVMLDCLKSKDVH